MILTTRAGLAVVILLLAAGVYLLLVGTATTAPKSTTATAAPQALVLQTQRIPIQRQWRGYGTVQALDSADVPARITATVNAIADNILAGKPVTQGQLLVQLDPSDFERRVEVAQQTLANLNAQGALLEIEEKSLRQRLGLDQQDVALMAAEVERIEKIQQRGAANQQGVDQIRRQHIAAQNRLVNTQQDLNSLGPQRAQIQAQIASQQSNLRLAQLNLQRTKVLSPIEGTLQIVDVEVGESLSPGQRIARVVNLDRLAVALQLPASARKDIAPGDPVELYAHHTDHVWTLAITRIAPEDDPQTRTFTVYVDVAPADRANLLSPGLFLSGTATASQSQLRWVVPRRSIRSGRVLIVHDDQVQSVEIDIDHVFEGALPELGLPDDQWAVLNDVFQGGELVLVNPSDEMHDGAKVTPRLPVTSATGEGANPSKGVTP